MIALIRIDNRLVHGQVVEAWLPRLGARAILVADDEAAASRLAQAAMTLALPGEIPVEVVAVDGADWSAVAARPEPVLVIFRELAGLSRAAGRGLTPAIAPRVNLGNIHFTPGRRALSPSLFLSAQELESLRSLAAAGFAVEARAIPSQAPSDLAELERRWQAAR
jgi:PTS system mannose-specific IIB component